MCLKHYLQNESVMEQKRWTIVVDTGSLLNKESRKSLQLLQGLKGTYLIIPRTGNELNPENFVVSKCKSFSDHLPAPC